MFPILNKKTSHNEYPEIDLKMTFTVNDSQKR